MLGIGLRCSGRRRVTELQRLLLVYLLLRYRSVSLRRGRGRTSSLERQLLGLLGLLSLVVLMLG
jgi:hypothetical protein